MRMFWQRSNVIRAGFLILTAASPVAGPAQPEVVTIAGPGKPLPLFRNSHATAMACMVDLHGLRKPGESDRLLIATACVFAEFCECDKPGKPIAWHIDEGLKGLLESRGYAADIDERVRYSANADKRADFERYAEAIRANQPVILTFCYDPDARSGLAEARRRVDACTSVVGIGYVPVGDKTYLICHDGLPEGDQESIELDRIRPQDIGAPAEGAWSQEGASLYRWNGQYANLVLTFVGKPQPMQQ